MEPTSKTESTFPLDLPDVAGAIMGARYILHGRDWSMYPAKDHYRYVQPTISKRRVDPPAMDAA